MVAINLIQSATATGSGPIKAGELREILSHIPNEADVSIKYNEGDPRDQRERGYWTLTATWKPQDKKLPTGMVPR